MGYRIYRLISCVFLFFAVAAPLAAQDAATIYRQSCASCHDTGDNRAPTREALRAMRPERVLAAMESGPMISMANRRTPAERRALAEFLTGKSFDQPLDTKPSTKAMCSASSGFTISANASTWNGWGVTTTNSRFQPSPRLPG